MNPKDTTSSNEHAYSTMRKLFQRTSSQETYINASSYIQRKKINSVGRQTDATFFTQNNQREVLQSKRRLRSRR
jgi:hypothetical protein